MAKVNLDGFIEIECPKYNYKIMKENKLNKYPRLKIQVFLNEFGKRAGEEDYGDLLKYTKVICDSITEKQMCECDYPHHRECLYSNLTIDKKSPQNL